MRMSIKHFVVYSILAHVAVLATWASTQHVHLFTSSPASAPSLTISLQDTANSTHRARPKLPQHINRHSESKPQPRFAMIKPADTESKPTTATMPTQLALASAHAAEIRRREIRSRVLSQIRSHLNQYFVYPSLAQREGWQGRVLLGFSVAANGKIQNIHVAAGSGYPILDTSAVAALSRVPYLYESSHGLQGERLDLQMPVIFRLQGG